MLISQLVGAEGFDLINIIHLINTGTLFKNLTFSENVQKILGKKSFPLTSEYTLKVSEQWQLIY